VGRATRLLQREGDSGRGPWIIGEYAGGKQEVLHLFNEEPGQGSGTFLFEKSSAGTLLKKSVVGVYANPNCLYEEVLVLKKGYK